MAILGYAANEYRLFWTNPCANWILPVMEFGDSSTSMNKLGITPGQNHQTPVFDLAVKIAIPLFQSHMARPSFGRPRAWWRRMWWPWSWWTSYLVLRGHSASDGTSVLSTSFSAFFWRLWLVRFRWILGLGALPSVVALLASLQGPEDSVRGSGDSLIEGFRQALSCRQLQRRLIGTAGSWFLFDVAAYGGLSTKDTKGSSCHETGPSWTPKKIGTSCLSWKWQRQRTCVVLASIFKDDTCSPCCGCGCPSKVLLSLRLTFSASLAGSSHYFNWSCFQSSCLEVAEAAFERFQKIKTWEGLINWYVSSSFIFQFSNKNRFEIWASPAVQGYPSPFLPPGSPWWLCQYWERRSWTSMVSPLGEIARSSKVKTWKGTIYMVYQYILGMYTCMYVDHAYGIYSIHNHDMMVYIYIYV